MIDAVEFLISNKYKPKDSLEKEHLSLFREFVTRSDKIAIYSRDNIQGHITASAIVVNTAMNKVLVMDHIIHNFYKQLGGHADGNSDLLQVALTETREEAGLEAIPLSPYLMDIVVWNHKSHVRKGQFVPQHLHFDVGYLLTADDKADLKVAKDEGRKLEWISLEQWRDKQFEPDNETIRLNPHNPIYNRRIYDKIINLKQYS